MVRRQPRQAAARPAGFKRVNDQAHIVDHVGVGQHHAFGAARGTRRVLQHGQVVGGNRSRLPAVAEIVGDRVRGDPRQLSEVGRIVHQPFHALGDIRQRQGRLGRRVTADGFDAGHIPVAARRVSRNRNGPRVQAAQEPLDEFEAGRIQQQDSLAGQAHLGQFRRDRPGASVQILVADAAVFPLAIREIKGSLLRLLLGPVTERVNKVRYRRGMGGEESFEIHGFLRSVSGDGPTFAGRRRHAVVRGRQGGFSPSVVVFVPIVPLQGGCATAGRFLRQADRHSVPTPVGRSLRDRHPRLGEPRPHAGGPVLHPVFSSLFLSVHLPHVAADRPAEVSSRPARARNPRFPGRRSAGDE